MADTSAKLWPLPCLPHGRPGAVVFHPDGVQRVETQREQQLHLPAGTNYQLAALSEASVLWPVLSAVPSPGCAH
jgi:hypothetical protein